MQYKDEKSLHLAKILGEIIKEKREEKNISINKLANEYGLNDSNLGKIERALIECKFVTLWKISEALNMKLSELIKAIEDRVGEDFTFIDE